MGSPEEKICKEGKKLAEKIDEKRKNNERQTKGKALKQYKRNNRGEEDWKIS